MFLRYMCLVLLMPLLTAAQDMRPKIYNFEFFNKEQKQTPSLLYQNTTLAGRQHPEYGLKPFNAQCNDCVELIDKRTETTRWFISPESEGHVWSQASITPLHYREKGTNDWLTIDYRLHPTATAGLYNADRQMVPAQLNTVQHYTAISTYGKQLRFNQHLRLYFEDAFGNRTTPQSINYSDSKIGEDGMKVHNAWPGIDALFIFKEGRVKTEYHINEDFALPTYSGWLVIEDELSTPSGSHLRDETLLNGVAFSGSIFLDDVQGRQLFRIHHPLFYDAHGKHAMFGQYVLQQKNESLQLSMRAPLAHLQQSNIHFPFILDPIISGSADTGIFATPSIDAYHFTYQALGSCDVLLTVPVPGMSDILGTYVDLEYENGDSLCGTPPNDGPCIWTNVVQVVDNVTCGTSTGPLACDTANVPIWLGTCTTDSLKVPGANAIYFGNGILGCVTPQCPDYFFDFMLHNYEDKCFDSCWVSCAIGHYWRITVEACRVEASIAADKYQVCAGEPVVLTATPNCGVPPYHYTWSLPNGDTMTGNPVTVYPEQTSVYGCIAYDTCNVSWITNEVTITVLQSPPADAGPDVLLCEGGTAVLGGNPTTIGASANWGTQSGPYLGWISSLGQFNPTITVPPGTVDSFFCVVLAQNPLCFRRDTMWVFSVANPVVTIDSTTQSICENQTATLTSNGTYATYQWSNGSQSPNTTVNEPGFYYLIATDANGCADTSNVVIVNEVPTPDLTVFPDTTIFYGDSVTLYTSINLGMASIDSFYWFPDLYASCIDCFNPVVSPPDFETYGLVVYTNGCTISDSVLIRVILPTNFYIPNVFTPNGDGNNEEFYIYHQSGVWVESFKIFNRWGEKLHDGAFPWNGYYKGKLASPGVYTWLAVLGLSGEAVGIERKGSVTLVR